MLDQPRPTVTVDPAIGKGFGLEKQKFHRYLCVIAREKLSIVHSNWKDVSKNLKNLVWDDILVSQVNSSMYFFLIEAILKCLHPLNLT